MKTGKGRWSGATIFKGGEEEEARRLHGAGGGWHSEERRDGWGGRRHMLASGGRRWLKKIGSVDRTADWTGEKNMVESMRWARKIEGILVGRNGKEKREEFFGCWKLEIWFKWFLI
jgi:hypothetical protein